MGQYSIGDRVITNNLDWGYVNSIQDHTGWYRIKLDKGGMDLMDDGRLATRDPFGKPDPMTVNAAVDQPVKIQAR